MKWRGVPIDELSDPELLNALRQAMGIVSLLWNEVALRKLVRKV